MHPLNRRSSTSRRIATGGSRRFRKGFIFFLAAAVLLVGSLAAPRLARAQTAASFGSVDLQKVANSYSKRSAAQDQLGQLANQLDATYSTQAANSMLSADQQKQLGNLILKANKTAADTAQIQTLESQSQRDAQALAALQQKKDLTDADRTQLAQLTDEQQSGAQALQAVQDDYRQRLEAQNQQMNQQSLDDIRAAVAAVAKQKGLTVVFDASVAIYSANDITQAVITKLNGSASK
ncbi:MAG TPA: OmpH family outer membrane protein [Capsulimonadaceae bacterium]|nr:OmpH family outer membrane protein [Capsulimonadaceae bacterium]